MDKGDSGKNSLPFENQYSVTVRSDRIMTEVRKTPEYKENDSHAIFRMLQEDFSPVDFGFYLKRYVYKAAGYKADFDSVPAQDYIETITEAFSARGVPGSLKPTSTRLRIAVKNWLTRKTVSREAVIMLGFGLDMTLEDVNGFLTKALQECSLNPKDPVETICWYCLKNHLGYYHFRKLLSRYEELPGTMSDEKNICATETVVLRTEVADIRNEKSLFRYLNQLKKTGGQSRQSVDARIMFNQLYDEARDMIAELNNSMEDENKEVETGRLKDELSRSDRLDEEQKQERIRSFAGQKKHWTKDDITPVHFEEVLFSAVPRDRNGNLLPIKGSTLNEQFRGRRLNRQHIQKILEGTGTINRYDLATMSFLVLAHRMTEEEDGGKRYNAFVDYTNTILDRCGMGELYKANPYEAFLMICMLTDYPLATYADVWELSYDEEESEGYAE